MGSKCQLQPTSDSLESNQKPEEPKEIATRQQGQDSRERPGPRLLFHLVFTKAFRFGLVLVREGKSETTPFRKESVLDSAVSLGGTNATPLRPPDGRGAGILKAGHWAFQTPRPAHPAPADGSSGAVEGAASGQSSSHTQCSGRAAPLCGCAGAAPGQMGG